MSITPAWPGMAYPGITYPGVVGMSEATVWEHPDTGVGVRIVAYDADGPRLSALPEPLKWDATIVYNDIGSLSVAYSRHAAGGDAFMRPLVQGTELAVEVWNPNTRAWTEPAGCRFVVTERKFDTIDVQGKSHGVVVLEAQGIAWMLCKVRSMNADALLPNDHSEAGKRAFYRAPAGEILTTLLQEYEQGVGRSGPGYAWGREFDTALDSTGDPWGKLTTIYYAHLQRVDIILDNMVAQGMVDYTTLGRELVVVNPDLHLAPELSNNVVLHLGSHVVEAPSEETINDLVSRVGFEGGETGDDPMAPSGPPLRLIEDDLSAPTPWGPWEGGMSNGSVTDEGTARAFLQAELRRSGRVRGQYVRDLPPALPEGSPLPLLDYGPGAWITGPGADGMERLRVQQVVLRSDGAGVTAGLVLNDVLLDEDIRRAKRQVGIVVGSTNEPGSGVVPAPPGPDNRQPAAPEGFLVDSTAYIDENGLPQGQVSAMWGAVTTATPEDGGGALEVDSYQLFHRPNVAGAPWRVATGTTGTVAQHSPYEVGSEWQFKVRALGRYSTVPGAFSEAVTVVIEDDTTPPPAPSEPTVGSHLGIPVFGWDGLTEDGALMPRDFDRIELVLAVGVDPEADAPAFDTRRSQGGYNPATGFDHGAILHAAHRAIDRSGNVSELSAVVTAEVVPLVDWDGALAEAIDYLENLSDNVIPGLETDITVADGKFTASVNPPTADDAVGLAEGALWSQYDGNNLIGTWVLVGGVWEVREPQVVHIDTGTFGTLDGIRLKAHTVLAMAIGVGDFTNHVNNPRTDLMPEDADSTGWTLPADTGTFVEVGAEHPTNGTHVLQMETMPGNRTAANTREVDVKPEDEWVVRVQARNLPDGVKSASFTLGALVTTETGQVFSNTKFDALPAPDGSWRDLEHTVTAVPGALSAHGYVTIQGDASNTPTWQFTNLEFRRKTNGTLITPDSITTPHLVAGAVDADKVKANAIQAQHFEAVIALASRFVGGDPLGVAAELTPDGLEVYVTDPERGRTLLASFGSDGGDVLRINEKAFIDRDGNATFQTVSANQVELAGRDLTEQLWDMAKGTLERCAIDADTPDYATATEFRVAELEFTVPDKPYAYLPGRAYCADINAILFPESTDVPATSCGAILRVRYETGDDVTPPAQPDENSLLWGPRINTTGLDSGRLAYFSFRTRSFTWPEGTRVRVLVTAEGAFNTTLGVMAQSYFSVEDSGPWRPDTGDPRSGTVVSPPDNTTPLRTYTSVWTADQARTYLDGAYQGVFWQFPDCLGQGWTPGLATARHSVMRFGGGATGGDLAGSTITAALAGATVDRVTLRLRNRAFHPDNQWRGTHGKAIVGWQDGWDAVPTQQVIVQEFPAGAARHIDLDLGAWLQAAGLNRYLTLGPGGTNNTDDWGAFDNQNGDDPPQLIITYRK